MQYNIQRQSNMEILRILAMFLVLLYHSVFLKGEITNGTNSFHSINQLPNLFLYAISSVCVNTFVLISGWFGIHQKKERFLSLLFQISFYFILGYAVGIATKTIPANGHSLFNLLTLSTEYWFVYAYLGLYLFAPILNTYIEKASQKDLLRIIIFFFILQTWYGWFRSQEAPFFYGGHSTISFVGLYLLARYIKSYVTWQAHKASTYLTLYVAISIFSTILCFTALFYGISTSYAFWIFQYISPFTIISSTALLLLFARLKIRPSHFINHVSLSAFAVYLIHTNNAFYPYMEVGLIKIRHWDCSQWVYYLGLFALLVLIYSSCTLIDQIRLLLWKRIRTSMKTKK